MILFIEGPRACGKTYLIENFIKTAKSLSTNYDNLEYYKFYFAEHIRTLNLTDQLSSPTLHYFSLGNIMTILEMNQRPEYKNKVWVFDRAIISAYVWAILKNRLLIDTAKDEYLALLGSNLFYNCSHVYIEVIGQTKDSTREKDVFDGNHSTAEEVFLFQRFINIGSEFIMMATRNNHMRVIINKFDDDSQLSFNELCFDLLSLNDLNK